MLPTREVRCINESCGVVNRIPFYSITKIPKCGKCHNELPQSTIRRVLRKLYANRNWVITAGMAGFLIWISRHEIIVEITDLMNPPRKVQVPPSPGVYAIYQQQARIVPLTIQTAAGSDYFIKFETDSSTSAPVMSLFVHGGSPLRTRVPIGTFIVKHASGIGWCDERNLFGKETSTEQGKTPAIFDEDHEYTLRLIKLSSGNFPTTRIRRSEF